MDRFCFLMEEFNALSSLVAGCTTQVSTLGDSLLLTRCQMYEETCGRINESNLSHFMVMGAPYLPLSENIQEQLKQKVPHLHNDQTEANCTTLIRRVLVLLSINYLVCK